MNNKRKKHWNTYKINTLSLYLTHTYIHTLCFKGHFSRWTWVSPLILLLHLFLDCASFWDRPKLSMSFFTQSHQVFFGHPLGLIPSTSHIIQRLTQSLSSFRSTCPNHLTLLFFIIKLTSSNPKSSPSSSLFFLSFSLTPHIHLIRSHVHLIVLISVQFIFNWRAPWKNRIHWYISFFSAHHSIMFCFQCSVYWWKGSVRF